MYEIQIVGLSGSHPIHTNSLRIMIIIIDALNKAGIPCSWKLNKEESK